MFSKDKARDKTKVNLVGVRRDKDDILYLLRTMSKYEFWQRLFSKREFEYVIYQSYYRNDLLQNHRIGKVSFVDASNIVFATYKFGALYAYHSIGSVGPELSNVVFVDGVVRDRISTIMKASIMSKPMCTLLISSRDESFYE